MESFVQDLRLACRRLRKSPILLAAAMLCLALGIGAGTTVFALVDAIVLEPLALPEPDRLVRIFSSREGKPFRSSNFADFVDLERASRGTFSHLAASVGWDLSVATGERADHLGAELVSRRYFETLGIEPILGSGLGGDDADSAVAVIGHALWQRAYGGDPEVIGHRLRVNGAAFTITGVAPPGFRGLELQHRSEVWIPVESYPQVARGFWASFEATDYEAQRFTRRRISMWSLVGRLAPGVGLERASSSLATISDDLAARFPDTNEGQGFVAIPAQKAAAPLDHRGDALRFVSLLLGSVGAALLIACANLASLLLARAESRRQEISVRQAIGASRGRLIRMSLTESLVMALVSGALSVLITLWSFELLGAYRLPGDIALTSLSLAIDARLLAVALGLSLVACLVSGLVPALRASRRGPGGGLRQTPRTGGGPGRFHAVLITAQISLTVALLFAAGLFLRSLRTALSTELGFDPGGVLSASLDLGSASYDAEGAERFYGRLLEGVAAEPGVEAASLTSTPFGSEGLGIGQVTLENGEILEVGRVTLSRVGAGFFDTLHIPIRRGRDFLTNDDDTVPSRAIVNETAARAFWPGQDPLGKRFNFAGPSDPLFEVVGVAADSHAMRVEEAPSPYVYLPITQHWGHAAGNEMTLLARTAADPARLTGAVIRLLSALDPDVPIIRSGPLAERVAETLMPQRMGSTFLGFFALLALGMTAVGIAGVVAYSVSRKGREIGIRLALGASPSRLRLAFVRRSLGPVTAGLAGGIVLAAVGLRWIEAFLVGIEPLDPPTVAVTACLLLVVAGGASWLPARAASRVDPVEVLRRE